MTVAITELELTPGIWTPWAQILCFECHGDKAMQTKLNPERFKEQPLDDEMDSAIAVCDKCGKSIWMDYKVAWEQKVVLALREKGFEKAGMDQTGGMCSAANVPLTSDEDGGHKYVLITESEDPDQPHGDPTFMVGYYHERNPYGDDVEGEYGDDVPLAFDDTIALVERIAKAGRHVD
jgi:hypothetical protein